MYVLTFISWFLVIMPILIIFYQDNGLSMTQIFITQAVFSVAIVALEVPSGYFADRVGRKASIVTGTIAYFVGMMIYSFSYGFYGFLFAEIFLGFGAAFISGADTAILYDTLVELKNEDKFKKISARQTALNSFSEGLAAILGGFVAVISLRYDFYLRTAILLVGIPIALSLTEPKIHKFEIVEGHIKEILKAARFALFENKKIKWLMIYSIFSGLATFCAVWFIQPYWQSVGLPLAFFGINWAILQFTISVFALGAPKIESVIGKKNLLFILPFFIAIAFISLGMVNSIWGIAIIFIFYIVRGIRSPLLYAYINELIPSHIRATVLSVKSFLSRLFFAGLGPFLGWYADVYTLSQAMIFSGILFFVLGFGSFLLLKKSHAL